MVLFGCIRRCKGYGEVAGINPRVLSQDMRGQPNQFVISGIKLK